MKVWSHKIPLKIEVVNFEIPILVTVSFVFVSLWCDEMQELNLYAEFNGRTLPASQSINSDKFQVRHLCVTSCVVIGHSRVAGCVVIGRLRVAGCVVIGRSRVAGCVVIGRRSLMCH